MINQLQNIKERLFDAPKEVKESFNKVVNYFMYNDLKLRTKVGKKFSKEFNEFLDKFYEENDPDFNEEQEMLEILVNYPLDRLLLENDDQYRLHKELVNWYEKNKFKRN